MIDVTEQINAVRRSVGSRTLEAGEARIVTIGRTYDATVEEVWEPAPTPSEFRGGSCR